MVGLGILRETTDRQFRIRTRNLRLLLGDDDEIGRRFDDATKRMAPAVFDRTQFRSPMEDGSRSSLTAHQETRLLSGWYGVGLVFGTRLAGLDRVGDSVGEAAKRDESLFVQEVLRGALPRPARRRAMKKRKEGVHVLLVDMRGAWDEEVLARALELIERHERSDRIIRPVLWCDPAGAWSWLSELSEDVSRKEGVEIRDIWLGPCRARFHPRVWLSDQESQALTDFERSDNRVDLPWPLVVETAAAVQTIEIHRRRHWSHFGPGRTKSSCSGCYGGFRRHGYRRFASSPLFPTRRWTPMTCLIPMRRWAPMTCRNCVRSKALPCLRKRSPTSSVGPAVLASCAEARMATGSIRPTRKASSGFFEGESSEGMG